MLNNNERIYLWPSPWIMNVLLDAVELQKGDIILDRVETGTRTLWYTVEMYGNTREYRFDVADIPHNRSRVQLEVHGVPNEKKALNIGRQFAMLESLMAVPYGIA